MKKPPVTESPIACDFSALTAEQRAHRQILARQMHAVTKEVRELPDGYAFRFSAEPELCLTLAEFITLERLCCPFFTFILELEREGGPLWLRLTGHEGVKQFLQAELGTK
ncbi:MAG: hypothetical protein HY268_12310 [Deltaproteobacteria bacterium]|nr:hypothetical protein [Deltaproteobacteria bacterium]